MLPDRVRDALALTLAGIVLAASGLLLIAGANGMGLTIAEGGSAFVVATVEEWSSAHSLGILPGDSVVSIDGRPASDYLQRSEPGSLPVDPNSLLTSVSFMDIQAGAYRERIDLRPYTDAFRISVIVFLSGLLVLIGGLLWLWRGRGGTALRRLAVPLACASAVPLLGAPLIDSLRPIVSSAAPVTATLGALLLADGLAALMASRRQRAAALIVALALAVTALAPPITSAAAGLAWGYGRFAPNPLDDGISAFVLWAILAVPLVPALMLLAARPLPGSEMAAADNPPALWFLAAVATPAVSMLVQTAGKDHDWGYSLLIPVWLVALVVVRERTRGGDRDLTISVTEAERARLAAELHDDALQELTLLVRQLDATGDTTAAELARGVSDRLRDLCGELHLPILDELGAGPALDWLVGRVSATTGEELRLERNDPCRPPAAVELTMFRVAQEAISNAVTHGGPPIVVRYTASPFSATLSVDDAGAGLELGRDRIEPRPGHYGLATMQQRAEQIGALLSIRAWPKGGTHVSLEWTAP